MAPERASGTGDRSSPGLTLLVPVSSSRSSHLSFPPLLCLHFHPFPEPGWHLWHWHPLLWQAVLGPGSSGTVGYHIAQGKRREFWLGPDRAPCLPDWEGPAVPSYPGGRAQHLHVQRRLRPSFHFSCFPALAAASVQGRHGQEEACRRAAGPWLTLPSAALTGSMAARCLSPWH